MNPRNFPSLPISERALLNTLVVRYRGGELLPQGENLAYLRAIRDIAAAAALVRAARQPPLAAIAAWHLAVEETSAETAGFIWDRYFCPHFTQAERAQIIAAKDRLRRQIPSPDFPAARAMHLEQLRASLRLDEPEAAAPFCLPPGTSGERREQLVTRASLEVLRAMQQAGLLTGDELRRYVETFWQAAEARARHWRRFQEEVTLLDFLKKFIEQTEGARQAGNDPPLSEETWAWKIWIYLEGNEQHQGWLRRRLAEHVPAASARRRVPRCPPPARPAPHVPVAADLRAGLIRFFRLAPLLVRSNDGGGAETTGKEDELSSLASDEIRRIARVEVLLATICPEAAPLLPPEIYALPLVRVLRDAIAKMPASGVRRGENYRRAMRVLKRLVHYYSAYDPHAPLIRVPSLARFPADAVKRWEKLIRQLGRDGVKHFLQRTVQLQLVRALSVAVTPDLSEANRRVCAGPSLRRQLDTERIGLGRRRRNDSHTELATVALKLRRRIGLLRISLACGPFPPAVASAAGELLEAAVELAELARRDDLNSKNVVFAVHSLFDNTIRPAHGRLETAVQSVPPVLGDPDLRRRLNAVREAAARLVWTAEDLTDGFFRERRNVGLRWLLGRRSGEREDDLLSPD